MCARCGTRATRDAHCAVAIGVKLAKRRLKLYLLCLCQEADERVRIVGGRTLLQGGVA